jgi:hypothetical protein
VHPVCKVEVPPQLSSEDGLSKELSVILVLHVRPVRGLHLSQDVKDDVAARPENHVQLKL